MANRAIAVSVTNISKDASGRAYDPGFEVAVEIQRWFYYRHKWHVSPGAVRSADQLRETFRAIHRDVYGKATSNPAYESVILEKDIRDFIESHKDRVAELEMLR